MKWLNQCKQEREFVVAPVWLYVSFLPFFFPFLFLILLQIWAPRLCPHAPIYGCYASPWWWPCWRVRGDPPGRHPRGERSDPPSVNCTLGIRSPKIHASRTQRGRWGPWQSTEGPKNPSRREKKTVILKKSYTNSNKEDALMFFFLFLKERPLLQITALRLWTSWRAQRQVGDNNLDFGWKSPRGVEGGRTVCKAQEQFYEALKIFVEEGGGIYRHCWLFPGGK